jgi:hypothetical protein
MARFRKITPQISRRKSFTRRDGTTIVVTPFVPVSFEIPRSERSERSAKVWTGIVAINIYVI